MLRVAHAGALEDRRRADGAGRQHRLDPRGSNVTFAVEQELDSGRAQSVERHTIDRCAGDDSQILAMSNRLQERLARVPPDTAPLVDFEAADTGVVAAIEVVGARDTCLLHRIREPIEDVARGTLDLLLQNAEEPLIDEVSRTGYRGWSA